MPTQPNILWIYSDELRTDALGCYGNPHVTVRTPHIDDLAHSGVRFDRCYCNSPVCVPSRMATMTGLYPEDTGVYHNEAYWGGFRMPRQVTTFPEVFAAAGYATADFGKIHLPRELKPWQHRRDDGGQMGDLSKPFGKERHRVVLPAIKTTHGGSFPPDIPYPPEQVTSNGLEWIAAQRGPFLVRLSYLQPHTPVYPPPPYDSLYDSGLFRDRPTSVLRTLSTFEQAFAAVCRGHDLSSRDTQLAQSHYYGLVSWLDAQVGRVRQALCKLGLEKNTIIIFGADHGAHLGEYGCYGKHTFAPHVHRVPFIVSFPGRIAGTAVRSDLCDSIDLPRTLFALCGIDAPSQFKGRDLFSGAAPQAIYSTIGYGLPGSKAFPNSGNGDYFGGRSWPRRSCIRTLRYRLDRNVRQDGKLSTGQDRDVFLADCQADPAEQVNLAGRPELREVEQRLSTMLDAHLANALEVPPELVARQPKPASPGSLK